ncbi:energy-coupling factor transporter transmembrane component T family protein [Taklimakanibacter deserti]|uniref:energy-coupling factor transporter transmembrane component T family protein n=1 Tax=Taklimakanibacter deserti TaxID=2267839 RepID=UPI000E650A17
MLSTLHPLPKLVICLLWIVMAILMFDAWFQLAAILLCVAALIVLEGKPPLLVLGLMVPFALFGFGFLTTSVLFRVDSDFALHAAEQSPFASQAFSAGIVLFLRAIACGMISAVFVLTTDPGHFIKALMADWKLSPRIGYSLFSALQLVPDLASELRQIRIARAMKRGKPPSAFIYPQELVTLFIPLLAYAIRRAGRAAIAMEARGLGAGQARTILAAPRLGRRDAVFAGIALGLLIVALAITLI